MGKKKKTLWIIMSEYDLLTHSLQKELIQFDEVSTEVILSPFMISISSNIGYFEEYVWSLDDEQIKTLNLRNGSRIFSPLKSFDANIQFEFFVRNIPSNDC